jgi:hypothetical protein
MTQPFDVEGIDAEIERIRSLGVDALRMRWRLTFGSPAPAALTKDLIARMVTYRLQEESFGGLDRATAKDLDAYTGPDKATGELTRRLKPGTVLSREYRGERHTVTVAPDGFIWHETTYGQHVRC